MDGEVPPLLWEDPGVRYRVWSLKLKFWGWGLLKIRGTFLGVPLVRTRIHWGQDWGALPGDGPGYCEGIENEV